MYEKYLKKKRGETPWSDEVQGRVNDIAWYWSFKLETNAQNIALENTILNARGRMDQIVFLKVVDLLVKPKYF